MIVMRGEYDVDVPRALVVDDELIARCVVVANLEEVGFACDEAPDGDVALRMLSEEDYDLLVADVRMPNKNGHSLVVDVLGMTRRPMIVVHTAVDDPLITRDFVNRGVDDVVHKPTNYRGFAAKVLAMVEKRRAERDAVGRSPGRAVVEAEPTISAPELWERLSRLDQVFPISGEVLDLYNLAMREDAATPEIVEAIDRAPSVAAQLLRLVNAAASAPGAAPVSDLNNAVLRVGRRAIANLAIAIAGRGVLSADPVPWLDSALVWRRGVVAGQCVETLAPPDCDAETVSQLKMSALLSGFGRLAMAALFPVEHRELTTGCRNSRAPLVDAETRVFGVSHSRVAERLLAAWNLPLAIRRPIEHLSSSFAELALPDAGLQRNVELVKLAVLAAEIVVGDWQPFDTIDLPSSKLLERFGSDAIKRTLDVAARTAAALPPSPDSHLNERRGCGGPWGYVRTPGKSAACDLLWPLLHNAGVEICAEEGATSERVLLNGLDCGRRVLERDVTDATDRITAIVRSDEQAALFSRAVVLPTSAGRALGALGLFD